MADASGWDERRSRREVAADQLRILGTAAPASIVVDRSEHGLRIASREPLHLTVQLADEDETREAILVWARRDESGGMIYGLEFIGAESADVNHTPPAPSTATPTSE